MPTITAEALNQPQAEAALLDTSVAEVEPDWGAIAEASSFNDDEEGVVEGDQEVVDTGKAPLEVATETAVAESPAVIAEPAPVVEAVQAAAPVVAPVALAEPSVTEAEQETSDLANLEALYGLTDAEAEALATEPELVLPKMLAKQHLRMTKSILASVQSVLPQMMQASAQSASVETAARNQFFSANKDLDKPEYQAAILQVGKMFRQVNPKATSEVAVQRIGEMVRMSLGLPVQSVGAVETIVPPAPAVPAVRPFTPARGGSGSSVSATPGVWEELSSAD